MWFLPTDVLGHVLLHVGLRDVYALRRTSKAMLQCTRDAQVLLPAHDDFILGVCADNIVTIARDFPLIRHPPIVVGIMQLDCFATYMRVFRPSQLTLAPCSVSTDVFRDVMRNGAPACVRSLALTVTFDNLCHIAPYREGAATDFLHIDTLLLNVYNSLPLELVLSWLLPRMCSLRYLLACGAVYSMVALTKHLPRTLVRLELSCTNAHPNKPLASLWPLIELFELPIVELDLHHLVNPYEDMFVIEALRCAQRLPDRLCMSVMSLEALRICRDRGCDAYVSEHAFEFDQYSNDLIFYD